MGIKKKGQTANLTTKRSVSDALESLDTLITYIREKKTN
jgi:hypothetical protein